MTAMVRKKPQWQGRWIRPKSSGLVHPWTDGNDNSDKQRVNTIMELCLHLLCSVGETTSALGVSPARSPSLAWQYLKETVPVWTYALLAISTSLNQRPRAPVSLDPHRITPTRRWSLNPVTTWPRKEGTSKVLGNAEGIGGCPRSKDRFATVSGTQHCLRTSCRLPTPKFAQSHWSGCGHPWVEDVKDQEYWCQIRGIFEGDGFG